MMAHTTSKTPHCKQMLTGMVELARSTPLKAIRRFCGDCVGQASAIRDCLGDEAIPPCPFYRYRMGRGRPKLRIIRQHCLWCMGGSSVLVRNCHSAGCRLHLYRLGKNPKKSGMGGRKWNFEARKSEIGISIRTAAL